MRLNTKFRKFAFLILLVILPALSGCGLFSSLGEDTPFTFPGADEVNNVDGTGGGGTGGDDSSGGLCESVTCNPGEECNPADGTCRSISTGQDCTQDSDCASGEVCDTSSNTCTAATCSQDSSICSDTEKCVNDVCECDDTKTQCSVSVEACEVQFAATLAIKIDAVTGQDHLDSPPPCCEYADADGAALCPLDAAQLGSDPEGGFLKAPSENTDLFCCAQDSGQDVTGRPDMHCDAENRHGGVPELAVSRWPANGAIGLKFDLSQFPDCSVELDIADFPEYRLENSAFDASLLIDGGQGYQSRPGGLNKPLNPDSVISDCTTSTDSNGNLQISIQELPLRFMVALYQNSAKCQQVEQGTSCPNPFTALFSGESPASFQIIPGFDFDELKLTTGQQTQAVIDAAKQSGPMTITGLPLQFDTASQTSKMALVAAFTLPDNGTVFRDDNVGVGQLQAQLNNAQLTARLEGNVTRLDGTPIQTLEDLTTNCVVGGGTSGGGLCEGVACNQGEECDPADGTCKSTSTGQACTQDSDCVTGEVCDSTTNTCKSISTGQACTQDSDCVTGEACDSATKTCTTGGGTAGSGPVRIDEVEVTTPNNSVVAVFPGAVETVFPETRLGGQTRSKLFQISNPGSENLTIQNITVADSQSNFRLGSIYDGDSFDEREWVIGRQPWVLKAQPDEHLFFFLNYGPFGRASGADSTRVDVASVNIQTSQGNIVLPVSGTAKSEDRAVLAFLFEDESRFGVTQVADEDGPGGEHLYTPKDALFSFRQDGSARKIFLSNQGRSTLELRSFSFTPDPENKISFTVHPDFTACVEGDGSQCPSLEQGAAPLEVGTIQFSPNTSGPHQVSAATFNMEAVSSRGGNEDAPLLAGSRRENTDRQIQIDLQGANGLLSGTFDLKIHRLVAGFEKKINSGLQKSLIVSSATKGILARLGLSQFAPDQWKENFVLRGVDLQGGIELNAVTGEVTLRKVITEPDANANAPARPANVNGLRLYNALGSRPPDTEYFAQCGSASLPNCAFFYLMIGDWTGSTDAMTCSGTAGRLPVVAYPDDNAQKASLFAQVLKPDISAELDCLRSNSGIADAKGTYDPVTGELTFPDLAVRLYAPDVGALADNPTIDATLRLALTTGCVDESLVPDPAAVSAYRVPQRTSDATDFDQRFMPSNPVTPFTDISGTNCAERELHGRPMFTPGDPARLDNGSDSDSLNFEGFDIVGVGRNVASDGRVDKSNMYIIINAEVGDF